MTTPQHTGEVSMKDEQQMTVEEWLAIRKEEALRIDPATAEVDWSYALVGDPYGVEPEPPEEFRCFGRAYFARRPGSKVWVSFDDLPDEAHAALWDKHKSKLAFPAGLNPDPEEIERTWQKLLADPETASMAAEAREAVRRYMARMSAQSD